MDHFHEQTESKPANGAGDSRNGDSRNGHAENGSTSTALVRVAAPTELAQRQDRPAEGESEEAGYSLGQVFSVFRGRWPLAIMLALFFAGVGGWLGYRAGVKHFSSSAQIRVVPYLPKVLYQTEQNGVMPMYDSFVNSQVQLLTNRRTVELALDDPAWAATQRGGSDQVIIDFMRDLRVTRDGEMVFVTYTDEDPAVALAGTKAAINAYEKIEVEAQSKSGELRNLALQQRLTELNNDLRAAENGIRAVTNVYGTSDLASLYEMRMTTLSDLQSKLDAAETALAGVGNLGEDDQAEGDMSNWSDEQVAANDPSVARALTRVKDQEIKVELLGRQMGEQHKQVRQEREVLDLYSEKLSEARSTFLQMNVGGAGQSTMVKTEDGRIVPLDVLKNRVADLGTRVAADTEQLKKLGQNNLELSDLRRGEEQAQRKIEETQARVDGLRLEGQMAGRVQIVSEGSRPLVPSSDTRPTLATAGGMAGALFGLGAVALLGLADPRIRDARDAQDSLVRTGLTDHDGPAGAGPLLGVLPHLSADWSDPEEGAAAAHCVHELRVLLQSHLNRQFDGGRVGRGRVLAMTGPSAGCGKTTTIASLGLSLANSGDRVLLVDGDLVGGGLSRKIKAINRRKIGEVLARGGHVDPQEVADALAEADRDGEPGADGHGGRLGERLVAAGRLTAEQLDDALRQQDEETLGLLDALDGEPLRDCLFATGVAGLTVLPSGSADLFDASTLNRQRLQELLGVCAQAFDWVLVDSGPLPGSLEAASLVSVVDATVLVVSRHDSRPATLRSARAVRAMGGRLLGFVYNRAKGSDLRAHSHVTSTGASVGGSLRSIRSVKRLRENGTDALESARRQKVAGFGPLTQAVAASSARSAEFPFDGNEI